jgi:hypothetical protein
MAENSGTVADFSYNRTYYPECYDDTMEIEAATAINAEGSSSEDWNQIDQNGSNIWRFNFHFADRPKEYLAHCYQGNYTEYWASPDSFKLTVEIGGAEDENQITFQGPSPNESVNDDSGNPEQNFALDILGGVGGIYTSLGAAVGKYYLASGGSPISLQKENYNTKFTWDIALSGNYYDLPHEQSGEAKSVQVGMKIFNEYSSGSHTIKYTPEYTFNYYKLAESPYGYCGCQAGDNIYVAHQTTSPYYPVYASYEAV